MEAQDQAKPGPESSQLELWAFRLSIAALAVFILSAVFAWWQSSVAQRTYDRATGRVVAKLELVGISPKSDELPKGLLVPFVDKSSLGLGSIRFNNVDELLGVNPRITVKNVGDEPVEALRVETRFVLGLINTIDLPAEKQAGQTPWVLRQVEKEEYSLSRKLQPGQQATVSIVRGLLGQMLQAQDPAKEDRKHFCRFEVRCYGRIVGGPTFDATEGGSTVELSFMWIPKGFPEEKCRKVVDTMQPAVEFD